jgi:flagellar basal-body rod modification protein FlgD
MSDSTTVNGIDNIIKQYSSTNSTKTSAAQSMGKEDFLKMLVAQLKNQDPLNPMSGTDFATQLAQFSSLEQLTNLNQGITNLGLYQTSQANLQAVNLIGKLRRVKEMALLPMAHPSICIMICQKTPAKFK